MGKPIILKKKPIDGASMAHAKTIKKQHTPAPIIVKRSAGTLAGVRIRKRVQLKHRRRPDARKTSSAAPMTIDDGGDDVSASDSLVAIRALEQQKKRTEEARSHTPVATDQVSRLRAAHVQAASAAAAAEDASESTQERIANAARRAAAPTAAAFRDAPKSTSGVDGNDDTSTLTARLRTLAPPVDGRAVDVFRGSTGKTPPLALQDNYRLLHRQVREAARESGDAPTGGQMGMRVADVASQLVRGTLHKWTRPSTKPIHSSLSFLTRASESNETTLSGKLPRVLASTVSPLMDTFYRMLVQRATKSASIPPHLNDPQSTSLARIRQAVRVSPRAHEERMLRLPRAGEPPCSMDERCAGNQIQCQMGGGTLVAFYYEDEWAKYQEEMRRSQATARLPKQSRLCLLCIRYDTHRCIMSLRCDDMQLAMETTREDSQAMPVILQPHFNLVDVEGEYPSEYCLTPVLEGYEGLPYPTVKPSLLYFQRVFDTKTGDVFFRQKIPFPKASSGTEPAKDAASNATSF